MAGKGYYFDPTIGKQAGDFEHSAQLDLGYALNLTAAGEDLVELPFDLKRKVFAIKHCVDLRDRGKATVTVTRTYFAQMADSLRFDIGSTEFSEVQEDFFARAKEDISVPLKVIKPFTVIKDDTRTNTLITEERYEIVDLEDAYEKDRIRVTTNFHRGFPYPDDERFQLQTTAMGSLEHDIEILYPNDIDWNPCSESIANPCFEFSAKICAEGRRLESHTRVTALREVVDHDGIEQYNNDASRLYGRRHNRFKVHGYDRLPATGRGEYSILRTAVTSLLEALAIASVIVIVFVHGWL